jgi:ribosomal protein L37AE/L43A
VEPIILVEDHASFYQIMALVLDGDLKDRAIRSQKSHVCTIYRLRFVGHDLRVLSTRPERRKLTMASHPHSIVCPVCESGELRSNGTSMARCDECGCALSKDVLEIIRQIAALPDAVGEHACECGHPEMRLLPDGIYRCPACGSEVLPTELI